MTIKPFDPMKSSATSVAVRRPWRLRISRNVIVEIISSLLILLFMYAAVSKLLDYETFKLQLSKSPFITEFAGVTAWALPVGEILVGLALAVNKFRLFGLYASLFLMTLFTGYIYLIINLSDYIPCSCGGVLSKLTWTEHLWVNIFFLCISMLAILIKPSDQK